MNTQFFEIVKTKDEHGPFYKVVLKKSFILKNSNLIAENISEAILTRHFDLKDNKLVPADWLIRTFSDELIEVLDVECEVLFLPCEVINDWVASKAKNGFMLYPARKCPDSSLSNPLQIMV